MQLTPDSLSADLYRTIQRLESDRERHAREIAAIDAILAEVSKAVSSLQGSAGLERTGMADVAPVLESLNVNVYRRGKFEQTGERSVLAFIAREGNPDTSRINLHWRSEGRRGSANVILLRLLKSGAIVREADDLVRGSRYRVAPVVQSGDGAATQSVAPAIPTDAVSSFEPQI